MEDAVGHWSRVAWAHKKLPAANRFFLLAIAYLASEAGTVEITDSELCAMTGRSARSLMRLRRTSEALGVLQIDPEPSQRQGARLAYRLLPPAGLQAAPPRSEVELNAMLEALQKEMRERVIPEIVETMRARALAAAESRGWLI